MHLNGTPPTLCMNDSISLLYRRIVAVWLDVFQETALGQATLPVLVLNPDGDDILARASSLAERYVERLVPRIGVALERIRPVQHLLAVDPDVARLVRRSDHQHRLARPPGGQSDAEAVPTVSTISFPPTPHTMPYLGNVAKLGMDTSHKCKGLLSGVAYGSPVRVRSQYP